MAYLYKYAVLLCHVTCTCTPLYAPGILKSPRALVKKVGLVFTPPSTPLPPCDLTPTTSLFSSLGSGKVVQVSYQCEDKSGKAGCGSVKTLKYLLDSALTLSISPIRVTSLSIRLEQSRKTYLWRIFTATGVHTQKKRSWNALITSSHLKKAQTISMISFDTLFEGVSSFIMQQLEKSVEQFDHLPATLKKNSA